MFMWSSRRRTVQKYDYSGGRVKTMGIDAATCTGLALVGDGEDRGKTLEIPSERGFLRLQLIANSVADTLHIWNPAFVAIEDYAYCKNVKSFVTLVEVGTVIRMALRELGISWVEVRPTVLKKWTTGNGHARKDQMALAVKQRWGFESVSHDIVDAFALAQMAQLGWAKVLDIKGVEVGWANATPERFSI
jgi:Holliday junction resolvasome RuvABC endonuclease subunit